MSEGEPKVIVPKIIGPRPDFFREKLSFRKIEDLRPITAWRLLFNDPNGDRKRISRVFDDTDTLLIKHIDKFTSPSSVVELVPFGSYEDDEDPQFKTVEIGRLLSSVGLSNEDVLRVANHFMDDAPRVGENGIAQLIANTLNRRVVGTNGDDIKQRLVYVPKQR